MADESTESILLDTGKFDATTRRWTVPILRIRGVKAKELYVGGSVVPSSEFSVEDSTLKLSDKHQISKSSKCYLVVAFKETNLKLQFWLPIILAVIGFLGAISQPLLHTFGLLYSARPPVDLEVVHSRYDAPIDSYTMRLVVKNLTRDFARDWRLVLAVRQETAQISAREDAFRFISKPFVPEAYLEIAVVTDNEFTKTLRTNRSNVQGCLFLVRTGAVIRDGVFPQNLDAATCVFRYAVSVGPLATEKEVSFH